MLGRLMAESDLFNAVVFDGTNDYLSKSGTFTGAANAKEFTLSFWIKRSQTDAAFLIDSAGANVGLKLEILDNDHLRIRAFNAATLLDVETASNVFDNGSWHHVLMSVDLTNSSTRAIYIDDVADSATWTTYTNTVIDWTGVTGLYIGATSAGASKVAASIAEFYLHTGSYVDLSDSANRRKFITANGRPAMRDYNGGYQGAGQPKLWLSGATASWHINKGSGGGFTLTGALTTAPTLPAI